MLKYISGVMLAGFLIFASVQAKAGEQREYNDFCKDDTDCDVQQFSEYWVAVNKLKPGNLIALGGPGCKNKKLDERNQIKVRGLQLHCFLRDQTGKLAGRRFITCMDKK
jgi:hypothetical protein